MGLRLGEEDFVVVTEKRDLRLLNVFNFKNLQYIASNNIKCPVMIQMNDKKMLTIESNAEKKDKKKKLKN